MSFTLPVESIADTAFVTAFARALESERPDKLFNDPHAQRLAGMRGQEAMQRMPGKEFTAAGCIVRTRILDELILDAIKNLKIDTVLNLGAGLDARPYRLSLPSELKWIEVDSAPVLAYKARVLEKFRPICLLQSIPVDVTDNSGRSRLLDDIIDGDNENTVVVTEGLLTYMTHEQVALLAQDLGARTAFFGWLTDIVSTGAMALMQKTLSGAPATGNVHLRFAPGEGARFFCPYGWEQATFRSCFEEGRQMKRWLVSEEFVSKLSVTQRASLRSLLGVVLLKKVQKHPDNTRNVVTG